MILPVACDLEAHSILMLCKVINLRWDPRRVCVNRTNCFHACQPRLNMVALHTPPSFEAALLTPQEKKKHYDKDYLQELQSPRTRPQNVSYWTRGRHNTVIDSH